MLTLLLALSMLVPQQRASADYRTQIEQYRAKRLAELRGPNGWLAAVGLFWVREGMNTAGSDPDKAGRRSAPAPKTPWALEVKNGGGPLSSRPGGPLAFNRKPLRTLPV